MARSQCDGGVPYLRGLRVGGLKPQNCRTCFGEHRKGLGCVEGADDNMWSQFGKDS